MSTHTPKMLAILATLPDCQCQAQRIWQPSSTLRGLLRRLGDTRRSAPPITLPRAKTDLLRAIAHAPVKPKSVNDRSAERRGMKSLRADGLTISQRVAALVSQVTRPDPESSLPTLLFHGSVDVPP